MVTNFNRKDLVSFGSYLLSEKRKAAIINPKSPSKTGDLHKTEQLAEVVHRGDVDNWLHDTRNLDGTPLDKSKLPLKNPANYELDEIFQSLRQGRTSEDQNFLNTLIRDMVEERTGVSKHPDHDTFISFEQAVIELKNGRKIKNVDWGNEEYTYLKIINTQEFKKEDNAMSQPFIACFFKNGSLLMPHPYAFTDLDIIGGEAWAVVD